MCFHLSNFHQWSTLPNVCRTVTDCFWPWISMQSLCATINGSELSDAQHIICSDPSSMTLELPATLLPSGHGSWPHTVYTQIPATSTSPRERSNVFSERWYQADDCILHNFQITFLSQACVWKHMWQTFRPGVPFLKTPCAVADLAGQDDFCRCLVPSMKIHSHFLPNSSKNDRRVSQSPLNNQWFREIYEVGVM